MKKLLAIILASLMVFPSVNLFAIAATDESTVVIVEFDDNSLLETNGALEFGGDYLETDSARLELNAIESQQSRTLEKIQYAIGRKVNVEYSYTHAFNGAAFEINESDIETIRQLSGVKNVYKACTLKLITDSQSKFDSEKFSSGTMVGLDKVREMGLDGEGEAVAVIDGGIFPDHEAFRLTDETKAKYTYDDINSIISSNNFGYDEINAQSVYRSAKIPFAFDYGTGTKDVGIHDDMGCNHGTHVSGIVAGNSSELEGVAPEAQILMFKINVYDDVVFLQSLIAALDDAVKFDVSAINMSVGEDNALTTDPDYTPVQTCINSARNAGILVCCAAGNAGRGTLGYYGTDMCKPQEIDYSKNGVPSNCLGSTSVASADNAAVHPLFANNGVLSNGDEVVFSSIFDYASATGSTHSFVETDVSKAGSVAASDLSGKVALVDFDMPQWYQFGKKRTIGKELEELLINSDALAILCASSVVGEIENVLIKYSADVDVIPVRTAEVNDEDFQKMLSLTDKTISFVFDEGINMSYFSSWALGNDLKTGVDITAPGGSIYSSVENGYEYYDGTSMASPHVAGAAALIDEYLNSKGTRLSGSEKSKAFENMLMNGADIVRDIDGVAQSPIQQGAGLMNIAKTLAASTSLTDFTDGDAFIELGAQTSGAYTAKIVVANNSSEPRTYTVSAEFITDDYENRGEDLSAGDTIIKGTTPLKVNGAEPVQLKVPAGTAREVTFNISVDTQQKNELKSVFTNGFYVNAFFTAKCGSESVSVPAVGFCGDWRRISAFDDDNVSISFDENTVSVGITPYRSLKTISVSVFDSEGNELFETKTASNLKKFFNYSFEFNSEDNPAEIKDGTYTVKIVGTADTADAKELEYTRSVIIDSDEPVITSAEIVYGDEQAFLVITSPDADLESCYITDISTLGFGNSSWYNFEKGEKNSSGDYVYTAELFYNYGELSNTITEVYDAAGNITLVSYPRGFALIRYYIMLLIYAIKSVYIYN